MSGREYDTSLADASVRAEHPQDSDVAICDVGTGKRLLGRCMLTRSMGDSSYNLTARETKE